MGMLEREMKNLARQAGGRTRLSMTVSPWQDVSANA
ncbi:Uncharacterised protein [Escherichia coli]|nr:Uncharacterised protein [Escherichia coli]